MATKFNLYEKLKADGFHDSYNSFGHMIIRQFIEEQHGVSFSGEPFTYKRMIEVRAIFSDDYSVVKVLYRYEGKRTFKEKTHLSDRRAYNAIKQTVSNNGYEY